MQLKPGNILQATPKMDDEWFKGAILLIAEVRSDGPLGFILNKPFHRMLNELTEFRESKPLPIYTGGPVDQEHLFFIHQSPSYITGGQEIGAEIWYGGDFHSAIANINNENLLPASVKIFIGYSGWDQGELEQECDDGYWEMKTNIDPFKNYK